jgi:hypothetical protein
MNRCEKCNCEQCKSELKNVDPLDVLIREKWVHAILNQVGASYGYDDNDDTYVIEGKDMDKFLQSLDQPIVQACQDDVRLMALQVVADVVTQFRHLLDVTIFPNLDF